MIESGFTCSGAPSSCMASASLCPNSEINTGETCDDGNNMASDGCSSSCMVEANYECSGVPSVCRKICSNGQIDSGEQCDDGNANFGDGCD